jgi:hypothetical protein
MPSGNMGMKFVIRRTVKLPKPLIPYCSKNQKESPLWQQVLDYFSKICILPGKQFNKQPGLFYLALKGGQ